MPTQLPQLMNLIVCRDKCRDKLTLILEQLPQLKTSVLIRGQYSAVPYNCISLYQYLEIEVQVQLQCSSAVKYSSL